VNQLKEKLQDFWKKVQKFFANMNTDTPKKEKDEESRSLVDMDAEVFGREGIEEDIAKRADFISLLPEEERSFHIKISFML